jgi:hypothetical protein
MWCRAEMLLFWLNNEGSKNMWLATDGGTELSDGATGGTLPPTPGAHQSDAARAGDADEADAAVGDVPDAARDGVGASGHAAASKPPLVPRMSHDFIRRSECLYVFGGTATVESDKLELVKPLLGMLGTLLLTQGGGGAAPEPPSSPLRRRTDLSESFSAHRNDVLGLIAQDRNAIFPPTLALTGSDGVATHVTLFGDLCERLEHAAVASGRAPLQVRPQARHSYSERPKAQRQHSAEAHVETPGATAPRPSPLSRAGTAGSVLGPALRRHGLPSSLPGPIAGPSPHGSHAGLPASPSASVVARTTDDNASGWPQAESSAGGTAAEAAAAPAVAAAPDDAERI